MSSCAVRALLLCVAGGLPAREAILSSRAPRAALRARVGLLRPWRVGSRTLAPRAIVARGACLAAISSLWLLCGEWA